MRKKNRNFGIQFRTKLWKNEYPLTYTNFVMVSQKNVTGLDGSSVVPEFIDYLSIHVD